MAFTVRNSTNPATMTSNWSTGVGRSGAKLVAGMLNPRRMFNADPAQAGANWQAGVAQAQPKYEKNLANTDLVAMENSIKANAASRYQQSATTKVANFQKASTALAAAIDAARAKLPPKGPKGTNSARSTAFQEAMHAVRGQISSR